MATENIPSFRIVFDANGGTQYVSDKDLNSKESAKYYAVKEFMTKGMDNQKAVFTTYARGLNLNSIIEISFPEYKVPIDLTKRRFIVREVITDYSGAKALDTISGVRYD